MNNKLIEFYLYSLNMSIEFLNKKYNFIDNKISVNTTLNTYHSTKRFNKTLIRSKEEKENSDQVLQKMQMSLNNFLSNLKKTPNPTADNMDSSFPLENETRTLDNERSFNYLNSSFNQTNNIFSNYQRQSLGYMKNKEKSDINILNHNNNKSTKYFHSPFILDKQQPKDFLSFNNSMNSFYSKNNKNRLNTYSKDIANNNFVYHGTQRANTENDNNLTLPLTIDRNKNNNNKILINENSSYSSEENKNIDTSNNNLNSNINNNNAKGKEPINFVNTFDNDNNDFKKLVKKIKEKKLEQNREKEKINNLKISNNNNNVNNNLNGLNEKALNSKNNDILLNSNNENNNKTFIKENTLPISKKYMNNDEEPYNDSILNRKRNNSNNFLDSNIIKKEYNKEKDDDNYNDNNNNLNVNLYTSKRSGDGVIISNEGHSISINNKNNISNNLINSDKDMNNIKKVNISNDKPNNINNNNYENSIKINSNYIGNINNSYDHIKSEFKRESINKEKIQNFVINSPNVEIYDIYKSNIDKVNYKIVPGMNYGTFTPDKELSEKGKNENKFYSNQNNNKGFKDNIIITKNNFEIINKNPSYKDQKDKILEKLLFENNALKETIIDKEKEIKQLNIDKTTYNGWDSSKYQQKIKDLEAKLKDNKSIKGQLNILKSQKTNLFKDYNKYKEIAETLKKDNEKLTKERDEFKKQRDKLNNEIKILKINNSHNNTNGNIKIGMSKTLSKAKFVTEKSKSKKVKQKIDKKLNLFDNESVAFGLSKEPSFIVNNINNINNTSNIVNDNNFYYARLRNDITNYDNDNDNLSNDIEINNIDIHKKIETEKIIKNKEKEMENIIKNKDKEISEYKEKIKLLNKEIKTMKDIKKNEKSVNKLKKTNSFKVEDFKMKKNGNKKYVDEINELKNDIKKLETEKNSLKNRIETTEKKKNNNDQLQKQNEDLKNKINYYNNQIKSLKTKNTEFEELFITTKSFLKIIKPSNDNESNLYYKIKNLIDFLDKEKSTKQ